MGVFACLVIVNLVALRSGPLHHVLSIVALPLDSLTQKTRRRMVKTMALQIHSALPHSRICHALSLELTATAAFCF